MAVEKGDIMGKSLPGVRSLLAHGCMLVLLALPVAPAAADDVGQPPPPRENVYAGAVAGGLQLEGPFDSITANLSFNGRVYRGVGAGQTRATYHPGLLRTGYYEVYLWWPQNVAGAGDADVIVRHAAGQARVTVDQRVLAGQWNSIGIFQLRPGATVQLVSHAGSILVVDAARFEYLGPNLPPVSIPDPQLPILGANTAFTLTMPAKGGTPPYTWSVVNGALPAGITLDPTSGVLAGRPVDTGHFELTVRASDSTGGTADRTMSIDIVPQLPDLPVG